VPPLNSSFWLAACAHSHSNPAPGSPLAHYYYPRRWLGAPPSWWQRQFVAPPSAQRALYPHCPSLHSPPAAHPMVTLATQRLPQRSSYLTAASRHEAPTWHPKNRPCQHLRPAKMRCPSAPSPPRAPLCNAPQSPIKKGRTFLWCPLMAMAWGRD
jgi:hypothetical protein